MSSLQEHLELSNVVLLQKIGLNENQTEILKDFILKLQESFSLANKSNIPADLTFIAIEETFRDYFDGVSIEIKNSKEKIDVFKYEFKELKWSILHHKNIENYLCLK